MWGEPSRGDATRIHGHVGMCCADFTCNFTILRGIRLSKYIRFYRIIGGYRQGDCIIYAIGKKGIPGIYCRDPFCVSWWIIVFYMLACWIILHQGGPCRHAAIILHQGDPCRHAAIILHQGDPCRHAAIILHQGPPCRHAAIILHQGGPCRHAAPDMQTDKIEHRKRQNRTKSDMPLGSPVYPQLYTYTRQCWQTCVVYFEAVATKNSTKVLYTAVNL